MFYDTRVEQARAAYRDSSRLYDMSDWAAEASHAELEENKQHFERQPAGAPPSAVLAAVLPVVGSAASIIASLSVVSPKAYQACESTPDRIFGRDRDLLRLLR